MLRRDAAGVRLPAIAEAAGALAVRSFLIDGDTWHATSNDENS
jgi:hypothetical protein